MIDSDDIQLEFYFSYFGPWDVGFLYSLSECSYKAAGTQHSNDIPQDKKPGEYQAHGYNLNNINK